MANKKVYTSDKSSAKNSKTINRDLTHLKLVAALCIFIGLALVFAAIRLYAAISGGEDIETPDFVGMSFAEAQKSAVKLGLSLSLEGEAYNDKVPGIILEQEPKANSYVKHGRIIYVIVSKGKKTVKMPDVSNLTSKSAVSLLNRVGITKVRIIQESSSSTPPGLVIKQTPEHSAVIPSDSLVTLSVSRIGADSPKFPDLKGLAEREAEGILNSLGVKFDKSYIQSKTIREGVVISQSVSPGSSFSNSTFVSLTISGINGEVKEGEASIPNLIGITVAEAKEMAEACGFALSVPEGLYQGAVIQGQKPESGIAPLGTVINISVEKLILVPSLYGKRLSEADSIAAAAGLVIEDIIYEDAGDMDSEVVIDQLPEGGVWVPEGTAINLTVSLSSEVSGEVSGEVNGVPNQENGISGSYPSPHGE